MGLLKFIFWTALAIVFLYLVILSIQNVIESQKEVDYWKRQIPLEENFYRSHGCTETGPETWSCPPGTPDWYPTEPEPTE